MSLRVTGIKDDHDLVARAHKFACACDDFWTGGVPLDERNVTCKLVAFDSPAVLRADLVDLPMPLNSEAYKISELP